MGNENKDVIRVFDTAANLPTAIRNGMIAYDTTNDRIGVKRLADGTMIWYDQSGTVDTTDIVIDDNSATAFRVRESSNNYFAVDTSDGSEFVYIGNAAIDPKIVMYGTIGINDTAPDSHLCVNIGSGTGVISSHKTDTSHSFTGLAEADTIYQVREVTDGTGGAKVEAFSSGAINGVLNLRGYTDTADGSNAIVLISGAESDGGTGAQAIGDDDMLIALYNHNTQRITIKGDGDIWTAGSVDTDVLTSNNATELLITNTNASSGDIQIKPTSGTILLQGATKIGNVAGSVYLLVSGTGDTYWIGSSTGLLYGSAQTGTTSIAWVQTMAQNTWYEISDSDIVSGDLNGISHDGSGKLTVGTDGVYDAMGIITMASDTINKHSQITFSVNGTPRTTTGVQSPEMCGLNDDCLLAITDTLDLSNGDTVEIAVRTTDTGNPDFTVSNLSLKLKQIGGT